MNTQDIFGLLEKEFDLKDSDIYFLDLIPLIQVIWADGMNQKGELKVLYKFVIEHIARLDQQAGLPLVSIEDANHFLDRFAHQKPDPRLLDELMIAFLQAKNTTADRRSIMDYCMDIAAAATTKYPFALRERVMENEKALLKKLFKELNISAEAEPSF